MNIVSSIRDVGYFENVEFLRILSIFEHPKDAKRPEVEQGAWNLLEGATYTLRVVQFIPNGKKTRDAPNDISINADEAVIKVVRGRQRAVGKYDVLTFVIRVGAFVRSTYSLIDVEYTPFPLLQQRIEPRISMPIQIVRSPRGIVRRILLTTLFVGLYFFPNFAAYIPIVTEELVKDLGILGVAVMVVDILQYLRKRGAN